MKLVGSLKNNSNIEGYTPIDDQKISLPTDNPVFKRDKETLGPSPTSLVPAVGDQLNKRMVEDQAGYSCLWRTRRRVTPKEPSIDSEKKYTIEYFIINLMNLRETDEGETDVKEKKVSEMAEYTALEKRGVIELILDLAKKDPEILEIETIKAIIDFKWNAYTFNFFFFQLILMLIVTVAFIIDVAAIADNPGQVQTKNLYQLVPRIISMSILSTLNLYEIFDLLINTKQYSRDYWNFNDQLLFFLYLSYIVLSFVDPTQLYAIKAL
jgi:hypothetical protein